MSRLTVVLPQLMHLEKQDAHDITVGKFTSKTCGSYLLSRQCVGVVGFLASEAETHHIECEFRSFLAEENRSLREHEPLDLQKKTCANELLELKGRSPVFFQCFFHVVLQGRVLDLDMEIAKVNVVRAFADDHHDTPKVLAFLPVEQHVTAVPKRHKLTQCHFRLIFQAKVSSSSKFLLQIFSTPVKRR